MVRCLLVRLQVGLQGIPDHECVTFEDFYAVWNNVPKVRPPPSSAATSRYL